MYASPGASATASAAAWAKRLPGPMTKRSKSCVGLTGTGSAIRLVPAPALALVGGSTSRIRSKPRRQAAKRLLERRSVAALDPGLHARRGRSGKGSRPESPTAWSGSIQRSKVAAGSERSSSERTVAQALCGSKFSLPSGHSGDHNGASAAPRAATPQIAGKSRARIRTLHRRDAEARSLYWPSPA